MTINAAGFDVVDFQRPYEGIGPNTGNWDFIKQDGKIYAWSESACWYEFAWWLDPNAPETSLVKHLRETRNPVKSLDDPS